MARFEPADYRPNIAIPPGETIQEMLRQRNMTQTELAERMGRPVNKINEMIRGKSAITARMAHDLELVLGLPASFWANLETNYRLTQERLDAEVGFSAEVASLEKFPLGEMTRLGWLARGESTRQTTRNLLAFFGVTSFEHLNNPSVMGAVFRKSQIKKACAYSLAAWLRKGEIESEKIQTAPFSGPGLTSRIDELRALTTLEPIQFKDRLTDLCASQGVALVLVPHLPKSYASGAAYWLADKAVIQLSFRFRTDDHFWFSFFHELAHILLHGKTSTFVDDFESVSGEREHEADEFSASRLIPAKDYDRLKRLDYDKAAVVKDFAKGIGIAPGIVVGRLHHDGLLQYNQLHYLKLNYEWPQDK